MAEYVEITSNLVGIGPTNTYFYLEVTDEFAKECTKAKLFRLDNDRIIIGTNNDLKIIQINKMKFMYINSIIINKLCWGICIIKEKGIFLTAQETEITVFRSDNYQCIQKINNAHLNEIYGIIELKDGSILSFEKEIKLWTF